VIQAALGIVQALYGASLSGSFDIANGDYVEGTIHPWLPSGRSFSNPMFAANMAVMLLALAPYIMKRRRRYFFPFLLGSMALILASVVHVLLFLAAAFALIMTLYAPVLFSRRGGIILMALLALAAITASTLLSS